MLKTAATIALAGPLLVMAVPILDTSFVVLKRLKYRRPPWGADHNHFYHRFMRIGFSQRRTAAYLHLWAIMLVGATRSCVRFVPPRPQGEWDAGNVLLLSLLGVVVLAASVWMVYTLEILKARHLRGARPRTARARGGGRWSGRAAGDATRSARTPSSAPSRPATASTGHGEPQQLGGVAPHVAARTQSRRPSRSTAQLLRVAQHLAAGPRATSISSTAPSRPSKIDHTGVPSTAASRFIVPPAETRASAQRDQAAPVHRALGRRSCARARRRSQRRAAPAFRVSTTVQQPCRRGAAAAAAAARSPSHRR